MKETALFSPLRPGIQVSNNEGQQTIFELITEPDLELSKKQAISKLKQQ
jgi:hypothetical protein